VIVLSGAGKPKEANDKFLGLLGEIVSSVRTPESS
jgi:hypothetical protein